MRASTVRSPSRKLRFFGKFAKMASSGNLTRCRCSVEVSSQSRASLQRAATSAIFTARLTATYR